MPAGFRWCLLTRAEHGWPADDATVGVVCLGSETMSRGVAIDEISREAGVLTLAPAGIHLGRVPMFEPEPDPSLLDLLISVEIRGMAEEDLAGLAGLLRGWPALRVLKLRPGSSAWLATAQAFPQARASVALRVPEAFAFGALASLVELDLACAHELGALPDAVCEAPSLEVLRADKSGLTALPAALGQLTTLRELHARGNRLTALPESVGALVRLERLMLHENRLTAVPDSMGALTALLQLWLTDNNLLALPDSVAALTSIDGLELQGNRLSRLPERLDMGSLDLSNNTALQMPPSIGGSVKRLLLQNCGIAQLPDTLDLLTALRVLVLEDNGLTALPASLTACTTLIELHLKGNSLTALPEGIGRLGRLQLLHLDHNRIEALPESTGQLTFLSMLNVAHNALRGLPTACTTLPRLGHIDVHHNPFTVAPMLPARQTWVDLHGSTFERVDFSNCSGAKKLLLHGCALTELPCDSLTVLTALVTLNLDDNQLQTLPDSVGALTALTELHVSNNALRCLPAAVGELLRLQTLAVNGNCHLTALPDAMGTLTELRALEASGCGLRALPDAMGRCEALRRVSLDNNSLTSLAALPTTHLYKCSAQRNQLTVGPRSAPKLQELYVTDNRLEALDGPFPALRTLHARNNYIERPVELPAAVHVDLEDNMLSLAPVGVGPRVQKLKLGHMHVGLDGLEQLAAAGDYLRELDLTGANLTALPPAVGALRSLWRLTLARNRLRELPAVVSALTGLGVLELQDNCLQLVDLGALPPRVHYLGAARNELIAVCGSHARLDQLDVSDNELMALPAELAASQWLHTLIAASNRLAALPDTLDALVRLTKLDVSECNLPLLPDALPPALQELDAHDCELVALPDALGELHLLKVLDVSGNQLTALPPLLPPNVQHIYAENNQLAMLPATLAELCALEELHLDDNELTALPDALPPNLQTLVLENNRLTALPDALGALALLEYLEISGNQLTALPDSLPESLVRVHAASNPLTSLTQSLVSLPRLVSLDVRRCALVTPPQSLVNIPSSALQAARRFFGSSLCASEETVLINVLKTMVLGPALSGKTSLQRSLVGGAPACTAAAERTIVMELGEWKPPDDGDLRLLLFDAGGQEAYHDVHPVFLTAHTLYVLAWDASSSGPDAVLPWLVMLHRAQPGAVVQLVATHASSCAAASVDELLRLAQELAEELHESDKAWVAEQRGVPDGVDHESEDDEDDEEEEEEEKGEEEVEEEDDDDDDHDDEMDDDGKPVLRVPRQLAVVGDVLCVDSATYAGVPELGRRLVELARDPRRFPKLGAALPVSWAKVMGLLHHARRGLPLADAAEHVEAVAAAGDDVLAERGVQRRLLDGQDFFAQDAVAAEPRIPRQHVPFADVQAVAEEALGVGSQTLHQALAHIRSMGVVDRVGDTLFLNLPWLIDLLKPLVHHDAAAALKLKAGSRQQRAELADDLDAMQHTGVVSDALLRRLWRDEPVFDAWDDTCALLERTGLLLRREATGDWTVPFRLPRREPPAAADAWAAAAGQLEVARRFRLSSAQCPPGLVPRAVALVHGATAGASGAWAWRAGVVVELPGGGVARFSVERGDCVVLVIAARGLASPAPLLPVIAKLETLLDEGFPGLPYLQHVQCPLCVQQGTDAPWRPPLLTAEGGSSALLPCRVGSHRAHVPRALLLLQPGAGWPTAAWSSPAAAAAAAGTGSTMATAVGGSAATVLALLCQPPGSRTLNNLVEEAACVQRPWAAERTPEILHQATLNALIDRLAARGGSIQVLHFAGHGRRPAGGGGGCGLDLEASTAELRDALVRNGVAVVVLNACWTLELGRALCDAGLRVVCWPFALPDRVGHVFCDAFYSALARDDADVPDAFARARDAAKERLEATAWNLPLLLWPDEVPSALEERLLQLFAALDLTPGARLAALERLWVVERGQGLDRALPMRVHGGMTPQALRKAVEGVYAAGVGQKLFKDREKDREFLKGAFVSSWHSCLDPTDLGDGAGSELAAERCSIA